ncbi:MAG: hypothetical protein ACQXXL_06950 [Candidatus Methanosuratincola sp.]|jgi:hypothetical protein|nr:hypothetical protein [Candidatus Methanosuratincola sp.]
MSEELKERIEELVFKWVKRQLEEGNCRMNLRIEIDTPIELRGMKGRIYGDILLGGTQTSAPSGAETATEPQDCKKEVAEAEMSLQEVEKLLRSLGV